MIYNQSGLPDPTAYEAICHVEAERLRENRRPLVYICSPYRGDTNGNIRKARKYCRFAVEQHVTPIAPHLLFPQFMGKEETKQTRELALSMGRQILRRCRELWWFGPEPTEGMLREIKFALKNELVIRHFTEKCEEVHFTV